MAPKPLGKENARKEQSANTPTAYAVTNTEMQPSMVGEANNKKMASLLESKTPLEKLVPGKTKQSVLVRNLRMWESRNFKQNGTLMSMDLLLLDEDDTLIQASIYYRRIHIFKDFLAEGNVYLISDFEVVPSYGHYKVTDHQYTIRFTDATKIIDAGEDICTIKREKFRTQNYSVFQSFAGTNVQLLDVVGQILCINGSHLDDLSCKQKVGLLLLLQDNSTIRLTLWDDQASEFRQQFQQSDRSCVVIVGTCLNPKIFAGKLHLNSTGSTKVYINQELDVVKDFVKVMGLEATNAVTKIVDGAMKPLEIYTIQQIYDYIGGGLNQEKEVICLAKITEINGRNGWKYLSCSSCSKKLGRSETALICNHCNTSTTIGVARFRVELMVQNNDMTATFVMFDRDVKKITHTTAEEITQAENNQGEADLAQGMVPNILLEMVGQIMAFQVKVTDYNFQTSTQTFTVTRVIPKAVYDEMLANQEIIKATKIIKTEDGAILPTFQEKAGETGSASRDKEKEVDGTENLEEPVEKDAKKMRLE